MSIALIGPDAGRRRVVATALAKQENRTVREFAGYPASIEDLERVLAGPCDVVMIDLDSDEQFALEIVQTIAAMSEKTVIVFSTRTEPDLVVKAMRSGARDLLPIPAQEVEEAKRTPIVGGPAAGPVAETQRPSAVEAPKAAVPQRVPLAQMEEFAATPRAASAAAAPQREVIQLKPEAIQTPKEASQTKPAAPDYSEWDKANLRPLQNTAPVLVEPKEKGAGKSQAKSQTKSQTGDEAKKPARDEARKPANESAQPVKPEPEDANSRMRRAVDLPSKTKQTPAELFSAAAAMPRPVRSAAMEAEMATPLFDSTAWREEEESKRGGESSKRGGSKKWMVLVAGPVVVAGLLYFVLMRPSGQNVPAAQQVQAAATDTNGTGADALPVQPEARQTQPGANGDAAGAGAAEAPTPASSKMMDAQLSAPSKIAKDMNKTPEPAGAPPVGPSLESLAGSGLPAVVPVSGTQVKVAPGVSAISAGVAEGMLIHKVNPVYPTFARENHMSGTVILKAKITKAGTIEDVRMVSGPRILGPAAMDAVKHWRYRPYMLDNQPVEVETTIKVAFLPVN